LEQTEAEKMVEWARRMCGGFLWTLDKHEKAIEVISLIDPTTTFVCPGEPPEDHYDNCELCGEDEPISQCWWGGEDDLYIRLDPFEITYKT